MNVEIRPAREGDGDLIRKMQIDLRRPPRETYQTAEFLIAWHNGAAIGCAATALLPQGGYFYGLAVQRQFQRMGIGSRLMRARLDALRGWHARYAVALVMFWNSRFFRAHGFSPCKRSELPVLGAHHADLTNPAFRRSAVMLCILGPVSSTHILDPSREAHEK